MFSHSDRNYVNYKFNEARITNLVLDFHPVNENNMNFIIPEHKYSNKYISETKVLTFDDIDFDFQFLI